MPLLKNKEHWSEVGYKSFIISQEAGTFNVLLRKGVPWPFRFHCVVYAHPGMILGWSEYLWIPGYSDKGGLCVVYAHPGMILGWSEYLWIPGYSDKGGLCVVYAHSGMIPGWSEYLWIPGYYNCLPCLRMVKIASVVSIAMTTTGTMYILRMAWRHWTWVKDERRYVLTIPHPKSRHFWGEGPGNKAINDPIQ